MTNAELIGEVAAASEITKKQAGEIIENLVNHMTIALAQGQDVVLRGIGKFTVKATAARAARNPITGDPVQVAAGKKVAFKVHKALKDAIQA
jgi:DNA-binding protein HU-beta